MSEKNIEEQAKSYKDFYVLFRKPSVFGFCTNEELLVVKAKSAVDATIKVLGDNNLPVTEENAARVKPLTKERHEFLKLQREVKDLRSNVVDCRLDINKLNERNPPKPPDKDYTCFVFSGAALVFAVASFIIASFV